MTLDIYDVIFSNVKVINYSDMIDENYIYIVKKNSVKNESKISILMRIFMNLIFDYVMYKML